MKIPFPSLPLFQKLHCNKSDCVNCTLGMPALLPSAMLHFCCLFRFEEQATFKPQTSALLKMTSAKPEPKDHESFMDDQPDVRIVPSFDDMPLHQQLLRGIYSYGFEKPSAIQQRSIVPMIQGGDIIGQAQSGTGICHWTSPAH